MAASRGAVGPVLAGLDAQQLHAVTSASQPLIIRAGAGSGKTRVLTRRVAHRAAAGDLDPRRALCVTFTREAAAELRGRLVALGLRDVPAAGTFHAIALGLLRTRWHDLRQPEPALIGDRAALLRRVAGARVDGPSLARITVEIDWARSRSIRPDRYGAAIARRHRTVSVDPALVTDVFAAYELAKRRGRLVDFDDLLERCAEAFRTDPSFAEAQRWRFRHVFVDEFQDVNPLQFRLLQAWLGPNRDLCAVGDANQAIYGWNGADPTLFERLVELLDGGEVVELGTNHRSNAAVVAVAGAALVDGTAPRPSIERHDVAHAPTVVGCADAADELVVIAGQLQRWHDRGIAWRDQAVLVRTNAQVTALVDGLIAGGVPAARAGGDQRRLLRRLPPGAADLAWPDLLELLASGPAGDDVTAGPPGVAARAARPAQAAPDGLVELAHEYAALDLRPTASGFLRWAATATSDEGVHDDRVRVGTFHRAKGREWHAVVVAGVEDGFVPAAAARLHEERRLFYVALSRAAEELLCTWAARRVVRGTEVDRSPSPFLPAVQDACRRAHEAAAPRPMTDGFAAALAALDIRRDAGTAGRAGPPVATTRTASLADAAATRKATRLAALESWRTRQARAAMVDPRSVLSDRALARLAADPPGDLDALAADEDVGPLRARRFGPALLAVLTS